MAAPAGDAYAALERMVAARTGISRSNAQRERAGSAIRRVAGADPGAYLARVEADPDALDPLLDEITVGETYFFREPAQFEFLRDVALPGLLRRRRTVRVWSAGCATGEEPYSLAMLARDAGWSGRVQVLATDLSKERIARARAGRYGGWSLRGGFEEVVRKHTRRAGKGVVVSDAIRHSVEFRPLNLARDPYPREQDVILCRNVLIYLDRETIADVARRLVDALSEDGWLLLSASDPPIADLVPCTVVLTPAGIAYQRQRPVVAARTSPTPPSLSRPPRPSPAPAAPAPAAPRQQPRAIPAAAPAAEPRREEPRGADAAADLARVRALADAGRVAEAADACGRALERHPASAELWYLRSLLLAEAGRHREAVSAARRALYLDRALVVAHVSLATSLLRLGEAAAAGRAFAAAERLLAAMDPGAAVPGSGRETAGRVREMVRAHLRLAERDAA